jgi:hypothetical protein
MSLPKLVVLFLFMIAFTGLVGVFVLAAIQKSIPVGIEGLLGTAVGALGSILAKTDHPAAAPKENVAPPKEKGL